MEVSDALNGDVTEVGHDGPPGSDDFDHLLPAACAGDPAAVHALFSRYQPRLLRYLRAHAGDDAEDVAGDVWLAVARSLTRFEGGEGDFRAWLFTIAHRQAVGAWRRRARRPADPVEHEVLIDLPALDDPEAQVVAQMGAQEAVDLIAGTLRRTQAEIVLLRVLADLDVDDVARIVGRRPGTVRVLQHRALVRLARRLSDTR